MMFHLCSNLSVLREYNMCRILQHIVGGLDDVSLAQHHPVIERYQLVFHVHTQSSHQLYSILKEKVKQLLRYVTFVCAVVFH